MEIDEYLKKGKIIGKKLDHYRMLKDICNLVETDFVFEMDCKQIHESETYTQEEAKEMIKIIGQVYLIAHCITCHACQSKYLRCPPLKDNK